MTRRRSLLGGFGALAAGPALPAPAAPSPDAELVDLVARWLPLFHERWRLWAAYCATPPGTPGEEATEAAYDVVLEVESELCDRFEKLSALTGAGRRAKARAALWVAFDAGNCDNTLELSLCRDILADEPDFLAGLDAAWADYKAQKAAAEAKAEARRLYLQTPVGKAEAEHAKHLRLLAEFEAKGGPEVYIRTARTLCRISEAELAAARAAVLA